MHPFFLPVIWYSPYFFIKLNDAGMTVRDGSHSLYSPILFL